MSEIKSGGIKGISPEEISSVKMYLLLLFIFTCVTWKYDFLVHLELSLYLQYILSSFYPVFKYQT